MNSDLHPQGVRLERWKTRVHPDYGRSRRESARSPGRFDDVETFCLFVGYPRSGHSLVGAMLNAHPHMVISHELDVLRYVDAGYRREQIYWLILDRDRQFVESGADWSGYAYAVPGASQGAASPLRVIGDKKGGMSTHRLAHRPELLDRLRTLVDVPLRIVHVVRNPLDNIVTIARRNGWPLEEAADYYIRLSSTIADVTRAVDPGEIAHVELDRFVAHPEASLRSLCDFLGVAVDERHLAAAAGVVFDEPRRTAETMEWSTAVRRRVEAHVGELPWATTLP